MTPWMWLRFTELVVSLAPCLFPTLVGKASWADWASITTLWKDQLVVQAQGCLAAIALSVVATYIIVKVVSALTSGIRVSDDDETKGLDQAAHGENGYTLS